MDESPQQLFDVEQIKAVLLRAEAQDFLRKLARRKLAVRSVHARVRLCKSDAQ
jgi:hypothetical protein